MTCENCRELFETTLGTLEQYEYILNSSCELIEEWNEGRRKANLPLATEGSLIDGIASLLMIIDENTKTEKTL